MPLGVGEVNTCFDLITQASRDLFHERSQYFCGSIAISIHKDNELVRRPTVR